MGIIRVGGSLLKNDAFNAILGFRKFLFGSRVNSDSYSINEDQAFVVHLDLSNYLTSLLASYNCNLIGEDNAALLNGGFQRKRKLVSERAYRSFNKESIVFTFLTSVRKVPSVLPASQLQTR